MHRKYKFISIFNLFWNIGWYFVTLGGWNDLTNSQTYKYSIVKNCSFWYFTFIMGMERGQNSLPVGVCLPTWNSHRLLNCYSTCPPHTSWRKGEGKQGCLFPCGPMNFVRRNLSKSQEILRNMCKII